MQMSVFCRKYPAAALLFGCALLLCGGYLAMTVTDMALSRVRIDPLVRVLSAVAVCLTAYAGARLSGEYAPRALRIVLWLCFVLYVHLVVTFTLTDAGFGRQVVREREYYMEWYVNFRPFATIRTIYVDGFRYQYISLRYLLLNLGGNLILFAPFALFLPRLFARVNRFWKFALLILGLVTAVELLQLLFMCGSCDVDDILLNVGGALATYGILAIPAVRKLADRAFPQSSSEKVL